MERKGNQVQHPGGPKESPGTKTVGLYKEGQLGKVAQFWAGELKVGVDMSTRRGCRENLAARLTLIC